MSAAGPVAVALLLVALPIGGGGALLVRNALAMSPPDEPSQRTLAGTVVEVVARPCPNRRRPGTCYRPVVAYTDGGTALRAVSRSTYRPAPVKDGDAVAIKVDAHGSPWLAFEWDARQADRLREFAGVRRSRLIMGWLLAGTGAFGLLLAAGLTFFVDRSGGG